MDFLRAVEQDTDCLAFAAASGPHTHVPSCPDWDMEDLVHHVGSVHRFWLSQVERGATPPERRSDPPRLGGAEQLDWLREGASALVTRLGAADPDAPMWNWSGVDQRICWLSRRMAHETAVHRWDAENAVAVATPIDSALAIDGIDEQFDVFVPASLADAPGSTLGGTIHLHATDEPGEWLVTVEDGHLFVRKEHAKGDLAFRASASNLLLLLWGRLDATHVEVFGDPELLTRLKDIVHRG